MSRRVAVVTVTHASIPLLADFAASLLPAAAAANARVVVVDSGSPDDTLAHAARLLPEAETLRLDGNRGFAAGINAGVQHMRQTGGADVFAIVNPDVRLAPDCLRLLADAFDQPGVGIAAPRLLDQHDVLQPSLRREPSPATAWCDALLGGPRAARLGLPSELLRDPSLYSADHRAAAWATGGILAVSDACLATVGLWDESYFMYDEEVDFCLRARRAGFALQYVVAALARRVVGPGDTAAWRHALMKRNRVTLMRKLFGRVPAALTSCGILVGESLRAVMGRPEARAALWSVTRRATPAMVLRRYRGSAKLRSLAG